MHRTLMDALASGEMLYPDRIAYRFLVTGDCDGEVQEVSYRQLAVRARAIAGWLQDNGLVGSRAMLLYPPGFEFVSAYLGCLMAGVIAVPGVPPRAAARDQHAMARTRRLIADADATVILCSSEVLAALESSLAEHPGLAAVTRVNTALVPQEAGASWREPDLTPDSVAFLQYTSGSTSAPRGVMITHQNLMANQQTITAALQHTPDAIREQDHELYVSWLPVYHDMGLIGPILNTLYLGATATLFSPLHFLQRPERWLTAISRFRPHTSGGPNFAYELCLRNATPELFDRLDLGGWRVAFNGAEPVAADTLRRFSSTFATAGFRSEAVYPCYGLAEATLMVTGGQAGRPPVFIDRAQTGQPAGTGGPELVGCGRPAPGVTMVIADPASRVECTEGETGEIWVAGASVARGYWRNALATREAFGACLADGRSGFLRTGDLGFVRDGQLFVSGRIKDLMVIDGRNHYPQDLELSVEKSHPALRRGCTAAFSVDDGASGEQAVIIAEASPESAPDLESITALIRSAVGKAHGLSVRDFVLVQPGSIPKTSSGKIQRRASRAAYLDGTLSVVGPAGAR